MQHISRNQRNNNQSLAMRNIFGETADEPDFTLPTTITRIYYKRSAEFSVLPLVIALLELETDG
ncbi:uncharacterized protein PADG_11687 [Paracoccidioides brasiliensis Pb18]|uniref:Uncharacterized protein n=2 Tax=Paracoccidioides brasiliensis TaxID=121759 RepID=A0A0A0HVT0_PARBD|nr:uncharacterized protein PADG_11687 [Paracoccidioides brasiliensis Pb18]KGM92151.1 hypothetical protein PADG_11687 [Paracoccidioides brasiliensis Pb18]ODH12960.1 hypothetical protein ACO22_07744 [Paracoccidioides brasiliensis]